MQTLQLSLKATVAARNSVLGDSIMPMAKKRAKPKVTTLAALAGSEPELDSEF
jgi:hypothetical protein